MKDWRKLVRDTIRLLNKVKGPQRNSLPQAIASVNMDIDEEPTSSSRGPIWGPTVDGQYTEEQVALAARVLRPIRRLAVVQKNVEDRKRQGININIHASIFSLTLHVLVGICISLSPGQNVIVYHSLQGVGIQNLPKSPNDLVNDLLKYVFRSIGLAPNHYLTGGNHHSRVLGLPDRRQELTGFVDAVEYDPQIGDALRFAAAISPLCLFIPKQLHKAGQSIGSLYPVLAITSIETSSSHLRCSQLLGIWGSYRPPRLDKIERAIWLTLFAIAFERSQDEQAISALVEYMEGVMKEPDTEDDLPQFFDPRKRLTIL